MMVHVLKTYQNIEMFINQNISKYFQVCNWNLKANLITRVQADGNVMVYKNHNEN